MEIIGFNYFTINIFRDERVHFDNKQKNMKDGCFFLVLVMNEFLAAQPSQKNGKMFTKIKVFGFVIILD